MYNSSFTFHHLDLLLTKTEPKVTRFCLGKTLSPWWSQFFIRKKKWDDFKAEGISRICMLFSHWWGLFQAGLVHLNWIAFKKSYSLEKMGIFLICLQKFISTGKHRLCPPKIFICIKVYLLEHNTSTKFRNKYFAASRKYWSKINQFNWSTDMI